MCPLQIRSLRTLDLKFSLFSLSLWTQGGSRALGLAGCRVTVGGRSLPILLVHCLIICRQPPSCPPRSQPLNRVIRKRRAAGGTEYPDLHLSICSIHSPASAEAKAQETSSPAGNVSQMTYQSRVFSPALKLPQNHEVGAQ